MIATRRDDRRWERERDREDIRHTREIEQSEQKHRRDGLLAWRQERAKAYAEFIAAARRWERVLFGFDETSPAIDVRNQVPRMGELLQELDSTSATVELIGSPDVRAAAVQLSAACGSFLHWVVYELGRQDIDSSAGEAVLGHRDAVSASIQAFRTASRSDLLVEDEQT